MASIRKTGRVWQAQVRRKGFRPVAKSFSTKSAAAAWAKTIESEIERGWYADLSAAHKTTVAELLARYETEILPTKRAQASERSRIKRLTRELGSFNLVQLSPTTLARYRNERLRSASAQTVRHELSLLRRVINAAGSEWGVFLPRGNPAAATVLPKSPPGRTRRLEGDEEERLLRALGDNAIMQAVICFALETALRRREIALLTWDCVNLESRTVFISITKSGIPRTVPLVSGCLKARLSGRGISAAEDGTCRFISTLTSQEVYRRGPVLRYGLQAVTHGAASGRQQEGEYALTPVRSTR